MSRELVPTGRLGRGCYPREIAGGRPRIRLDGIQKQWVETGRHRLVVTGMLFAICFAVLGGRLVDLTLLRAAGEPTLALSAQRSTNSLARPLLVNRAPIMDRNGVLLATNLRTASLYANPRKVLDAADAAARLVSVLPELDRAEVEAKLSARRSFVWLKRNLPPRQQDAVNRLGIPGLNFQSEESRIYPHGALMAHVLGFTDVDNSGIAGVERYFDKTLRKPTPGDRGLMLSVDVRVQHAVRDELSRAMADFDAVGAAGLVLDVATGELLSMVSLPDFDPNQAGKAGPEARFNRVTLGVYEMGSTFKTFTTAMALDSGTVTLAGGYDATKPLRAARYLIRDYHPKRRWLSVPEIYMYSSNIGSAKMARDIGPAGQRRYLARLGMLNRPAIELPEVADPLLPHQWREVETLTIAYGHGLSVSPLQLALGVATVVNGGLVVKPTVVRHAADQPVATRRVLSRETSNTMRKLMRLVVESGTGRRAAVPGYLVGGKTGTAEKARAGGYDRSAKITSFVAAFPMHAPRYVVLVMLDEPKGNEKTSGLATAGLTAAPAAGRLIARLGPVLGVDPVDESRPDIREALAITINEKGRKLASF